MKNLSKIIVCCIFDLKIGNNHYHYLTSDEKIEKDDVFLHLPARSFKISYVNCGLKGDINKRIEAISMNGKKHPNNRFSRIPLLPEYVIEAYNRGVREFRIEMVEKTIVTYGPRFEMGLLKVDFDKPKKETFMREEVVNLIKYFVSEESCFSIENFIDYQTK